ncbi:MAG: type II and III secretion system protein family protein [Alphaproteobacteria bacterium]|nr:type II and III secretion system protein family protein [Alphaproteobacteria bacterium]
MASELYNPSLRAAGEAIHLSKRVSRKMDCRVVATLLLAMTTIFICAASPSMAEENIQIEINKGQMIKLPAAASSVVLSDPTTADVQVVSPTLLFVHGKKVGDTSVYVVDSTDNQIYSATISVTHNLSKLQSAVKRAAPKSKINIHTVDGGIVLDGFAQSVEEAENIRNLAAAFIGDKEKMVNMIKSAGSDQVALRVKIVEMARNDLKRFGINLQTLLTPGGAVIQLLRGADVEIDTDGKLNGSVTEVDRTGLLDRSGGTGSQILTRFNNGKVTNVIDALETQGLLTTLAEPTLTTTSGKGASFLAGGEFPIPVKGSDGSITIEYKPFGVGLNFTPTVMSRERISIDVAPEVSSISFDNPIEIDGIRNPIILTRRAQSTVELGSGDTFMLAGLLRNEGSNNVNKFPGLGDLPVLGALFRSTEFQNNQTELVILVTPYVVHPIADPKKVQTPLDGYRPPNDLQRMLLGSLYQQQPEAEKTDEESMPKLHGKGGFIYE